MLACLLRLFRLVWLFSRGHQAFVFENLALRQQLAILKRKQKRPRLTGWDRLFWIALAGYWKGWRRHLFIVHPDTVVRWQRQRFARYWTQLSKPGRPMISKQVRALVQRVACANPLWRAPRIHGELLKLGIKISERTVSRILQTVQRPPSQTWRTFLRNHVGEIVATDFFTVPTVRLRVLFVFIVLEHHRRRVLHFGVTEHPTADWIAQQITEAFSERDTPRYLLRDRDASYGKVFRDRIQSWGISEVVTAARSPWQNAFVERLIGSIRRECLDHVVVLHKRHLRTLLRSYFNYYHQSRTHLALAKDAPESRAVMSRGAIISIPQVGGLHHRYERRAARGERLFMLTLNRSAIVIKPKRPFLDWLHTADPTSRRLTLQELVQEPTIYLIRECETEVDVDEALRERCEEIFVEQLAGWFNDRTTWPRDRGFDAFCRWFEFRHHSMLVDLCDEALILEGE